MPLPTTWSTSSANQWMNINKRPVQQSFRSNIRHSKQKLRFQILGVVVSHLSAYHSHQHFRRDQRPKRTMQARRHHERAHHTVRTHNPKPVSASFCTDREKLCTVAPPPDTAGLPYRIVAQQPRRTMHSPPGPAPQVNAPGTVSATPVPAHLRDAGLV